MKASRPRALFGALVFLAFTLYLSKAAYTIVKYKAYIWLPNYFLSPSPRKEIVDDARKHLLFFMVDHYESGKTEAADTESESWLARFRLIADRHRDSSGRRFLYTWFYPRDEGRATVLRGLARAARDGYGEVELHWHHPPSDSAHFPAMVEEALRWFEAQGVLWAPVMGAPKRFGFIHGLWALDGSQARCGVNRELDILRQYGCYADFTFSAAGTESQPSKINSIYYATDTDEPKSYDKGDDISVGRPVNDRLLIFEGPIGIDWRTFRIDAASVENYSIPTKERIGRWL